jgi:hypothetical protein
LARVQIRLLMAGAEVGEPDPALARVRTRLLVTGSEVGEPDLAYTTVEAVLLPSADLLSTNQRGSGSG